MDEDDNHLCLRRYSLEHSMFELKIPGGRGHSTACGLATRPGATPHPGSHPSFAGAQGAAPGWRGDLEKGGALRKKDRLGQSALHALLIAPPTPAGTIYRRSVARNRRVS